ncbi:MAG: PQQ-binding-like beta-propeller repeat protein, partial [Chthonomonadales bacterium]
MAVEKNTVYFAESYRFDALDIETGKLNWSFPSKYALQSGSIVNGEIYLLASEDKYLEVIRVDVATRKRNTIITSAHRGLNLALNAGSIYVLDDSPKISRYSLEGTQTWSRPLPGKSGSPVSSGQLAITTAGIYLEYPGLGAMGIDAVDGKIRWVHKLDAAGLYAPISLHKDLLVMRPDFGRINVTTGKMVWSSKELTPEGLVRNVVICSGSSGLIGLDLNTGMELWRGKLQDSRWSYGIDDFISTQSSEFGWVMRRPMLCVRSDGMQVWSLHRPVTGGVKYYDSKIALTVDEPRILCYRHGKLAPIPTNEAEQRVHAEWLVSHFEETDDAERAQIPALRQYTFQPLLDRYVEWSSESSRAPRGGSYALYLLLKDSLEYLKKSAQPSDTKTLLLAFDQMASLKSSESGIEEILMEKGDPELITPVLIKRLKQSTGKQSQASAVMLRTLSHSTDPRAVTFMIETLKNPKAPWDWRKEAFLHLAGTGGTAGVDAVRDVLKPHGPVKPWYDRIDYKAVEADKSRISIKQDTHGRTWMLFRSAVLGNYSDLFIVQKNGTTWGRPIF